jgi:hypothetical protein
LLGCPAFRPPYRNAWSDKDTWEYIEKNAAKNMTREWSINSVNIDLDELPEE